MSLMAGDAGVSGISGSSVSSSSVSWVGGGGPPKLPPGGEQSFSMLWVSLQDMNGKNAAAVKLSGRGAAAGVVGGDTAKVLTITLDSDDPEGPAT